MTDRRAELEALYQELGLIYVKPSQTLAALEADDLEYEEYKDRLRQVADLMTAEPNFDRALND